MQPDSQIMQPDSPVKKEGNSHLVKNIVTILLLVVSFVAPLIGVVGIIVMWFWTSWKRRVKTIITVLYVVFLFIVIVLFFTVPLATLKKAPTRVQQVNSQGISGTFVSDVNNGFIDEVQVSLGIRTGIGTGNPGSSADLNGDGTPGDVINQPIKNHLYNFHYSKLNPNVTYSVSANACHENDCIYIVNISACSGYIEQNACVIKGKGTVAFSVNNINSYPKPPTDIGNTHPTPTQSNP